jgi:hypothetical protein
MAGHNNPRQSTMSQLKLVLEVCTPVAQYKYPQFLKSNNNDAFDTLYPPSAITPFSGIYRCAVCGKEDVSTHGHPLPPQNHHQHLPGLGPIRWQLIVSH